MITEQLQATNNSFPNTPSYVLLLNRLVAGVRMLNDGITPDDLPHLHYNVMFGEQGVSSAYEYSDTLVRDMLRLMLDIMTNNVQLPGVVISQYPDVFQATPEEMTNVIRLPNNRTTAIRMLGDMDSALIEELASQGVDAGSETPVIDGKPILGKHTATTNTSPNSPSTPATVHR